MSTPGQSRHLAVGRSLPVYTQLRICRRAAITDAMCHEPTFQAMVRAPSGLHAIKLGLLGQNAAETYRRVDHERPHCAKSSSKAFASFKSCVSKPSVNQP